MKWIPTRTSDVERIPGAIRVGDKFVGRVNITTLSGSYSQVAKVESFGMIYRVEGVGEVFVQDDVEVLVCDPPITTITEIPQASEYFKLKMRKFTIF